MKIPPYCFWKRVVKQNLFIQCCGLFAACAGGNDHIGFETEAEPNLGGRQMYWPRGRGGGSSSINAMVYIRGNAYDYELEPTGQQGWSLRRLPYFKRAEDFSGDGDEEYHGHGGPLAFKNQTHQ